MRKNSWIIAIFAIFVLVLAGFISCDGDPDGEEDATVSIAAIDGLIPYAEQVPATTITATEQYTGTVTWKNAAGADAGATFTENMAYTATITLTALEGYTFEGVEADFFTVTGATSTTNDADSGVITAVFPATEKQTVNLLTIADGLAPVADEAPPTTIEATAQYTGTIVWKNNVTDADAGAAFTEGTVYKAIITLTATENFTFAGLDADAFNVSEATTTTSTTGITSIIVTAVFPPTVVPTPISIFEIVGLTAPVKGGVPVVEITANDEFEGTIEWTPVPTFNTFQAGETYTATVTLIAEHGYTFKHVLAGAFEVLSAPLGTNVSNDAGLGVVTVVFPATAACTHLDCVAGDGCTIRAIFAVEGYPFHGSSYVGNDDDHATLRNAPVYSSVYVSFGEYHDTAESPSQTSSVGRIGEGTVRYTLLGYAALQERNMIQAVPIASILPIMDEQAPDAGDSFRINSWRAYIEAIELHVPNNDFRPFCWKCEVQGCLDCFETLWTLADYVESGLTWPVYTHGSGLPFDGSNRVPSDANWVAALAPFNGKRLISSSVSATGPLFVGSANGTQYVTFLDDDGSIVILANTGQHFQISIGDDYLALATKDRNYRLIINGVNEKTMGTGQSNFSILYNGFASDPIVASAGYSGAINISALLPRTTVNPTDSGHVIRLTCSSASNTQIFQIRLSNIEIRDLGPRD